MQLPQKKIACNITEETCDNVTEVYLKLFQCFTINCFCETEVNAVFSKKLLMQKNTLLLLLTDPGCNLVDCLLCAPGGHLRSHGSTHHHLHHDCQHW